MAPLLRYVREETPASAYDEPPLQRRHETIEEQLRRKGIKPVTNIEEMAREGIFSSDEELEEFIAFTYRCRREGRAWRWISSSTTPTSRQGLPLATLNTKDFLGLADHEGLTLLND